MEQDRAVNDVMNEIDDHLEDSDEDTAYLVHANSGTGESQVKKPQEEIASKAKPNQDYDSYNLQDT